MSTRKRSTAPTIIRLKKHSHRFLIVDRQAMEDRNISFRAVGLHTFLIAKPTNWEVSLEHLAKAHTEGRDAIRSALDELKSAGYARLVCRRDSQGRVLRWEWLLFETTELAKSEILPANRPHTEKPNLDFQAKKPETDYPEVAKPEVAKPEVVNPTQQRNECTEDGSSTKERRQRAPQPPPGEPGGERSITPPAVDLPVAGKRKSKPSATSKPEHGRTRDFFRQRWQVLYGVAYVWSDGKDDALLKKLLDLVGRDEARARQIIETYLAADDDYLHKNRHPFPILISRFNQLNATDADPDYPSEADIDAALMGCPESVPTGKWEGGA